MVVPITSCVFVFQNKSITRLILKALVCCSNMVFNGDSRVVVSRMHSLKFTLVWRGPLDTRVLMEDQLLRTTPNKSVERASGKGNRSGGSMGSSLMNGWRGVVSSFSLFLAMVVKLHMSFFHALISCNFLQTPYHILCILLVAKRWWNYTPFFHVLAYGVFLQTLCCILNMYISSLLVMSRNRCTKIGERL